MTNVSESSLTRCQKAGGVGVQRTGPRATLLGSGFTLLHTPCVALDKLFNLLVFSFFICKMGLMRVPPS